MAEALEGLVQAKVIRPEVMTPLRDAVRLIDGEERNCGAAERADKRGTAKPLRGDVDELELTGRKPTDPMALFLK